MLLWPKDKPWSSFIRQKTLLDSEVPSLYHEPGIKSGYRLQNMPWKYYIGSVCQIHNETVNIWTHLGVLLTSIYTAIHFGIEIGQSHPFYWVLVFFGMSCTLCTGLSIVAHTFHSKSQFLHYLFYSVDYAGIGLYSLGLSIITFFCCSHHERFPLLAEYYLPINIVMSWLGFAGSSIAKLLYRRPYPFQRRLIAMVSFGLQFCFSFQFLAHRYISCYFEGQCVIRSHYYHMARLVLLCASIYFISSHKPETIFPGRCDIIGQGHQIFHIIIGCQGYTEFKGAYLDTKDFSSVTSFIPGAGSLLNAMLIYSVTVMISLVFLSPLIKLRVNQNQIFDKEHRNIHFD